MSEAPLILAIETSGDVCGVAVARGDLLLTEFTFRHGMHLSERLMDHVDRVLSEAGTALKDIELYAAGIGPGSFTGARIGVATIKVLAAVQDRFVMGVSSLDAIAWHYIGLSSTTIIPILACRTDVVYAGMYDVSGTIPVATGTPDAIAVSNLSAMVAGIDTTTILCGPALDRYGERLKGAGALLGMRAWPHASAVAAIAAHRISSGVAPEDPVSLLPLYMAPPPITLPKDRRGLVVSDPSQVTTGPIEI